MRSPPRPHARPHSAVRRQRRYLIAIVIGSVLSAGYEALFYWYGADFEPRGAYFARYARLLADDPASQRLIAEGKPEHIRNHPKVQEVYFGSGKTFEDLKAATPS